MKLEIGTFPKFTKENIRNSVKVDSPSTQTHVDDHCFPDLVHVRQGKKSGGVKPVNGCYIETNIIGIF